ncbi:antitoxin, partial [bacterium]
MSDFDTELVIEILHQIKSSCDLIVSRVEHIITYSDFIKNDAGLEKLDAVSMQLIAIGESIKNLDKITDYEILIKYPEFEWKK